MNLKPALVFILLNLITLVSSAQLSAGLNTGAIFAVGDASQYISTTYGPGVDLLYHINSKWAVGADGSYYKASATFDDISGDYIVSPMSANAYYMMGKNKWRPFLSAGFTTYWTEIHALVDKVKINTEDFFYGHNFKLGTQYNFNTRLRAKLYADVLTFYLRDTHNVKFFKDAITDDDLRESIFPNSRTFATLNLGLYLAL